MTELNEHLARVEGIIERASWFQASEGADAKAFSKTVVEDLGALADAVSALIKRIES